MAGFGLPQDPGTAVAEIGELRQTLEQVLNENELLTEAFVDAEFAAEDRGWTRLGMEHSNSFTRQGLTSIVRNSRLMSVVSPMIKRGLTLRSAYVWGQGVEIVARDPDINDVVQGFLDDPANQATFSSSQARADLERTFGTDGQVFRAHYTSPLTGRVQIRSLPFDEVTEIINNPDDRNEPWFYLHEFQATVIRPFQPAVGKLTTRTRRATVREYHPALGFWPTGARPVSINGHRVRWDAPVLHVHVNRIPNTDWGIPDAYASLVWARAYEGFLTDWARLVKSLSRFAWRYSGGKASGTRKAAAEIRAKAVPTSANPGAADQAGGMFAGSGQGSLEAIPKSGATIDSESGRPLAAMVAAGLGVSVVDLLADPGVTGARAVAETLDKPIILEAGQRRDLVADAMRRTFEYVIAQAIKAPRGPLDGVVARDEYGRETIDIGADDNGDPRDPTVEINWPDLNELDPKTLMEAIKMAADTGKVPGIVLLRLVLTALRVKDTDEILDAATDEDGNFIDPELQAATDAIVRQRRGGGPGYEPPPEDEPSADGPPAAA